MRGRENKQTKGIRSPQEAGHHWLLDSQHSEPAPRVTSGCFAHLPEEAQAARPAWLSFLSGLSSVPEARLALAQQASHPPSRDGCSLGIIASSSPSVDRSHCARGLGCLPPLSPSDPPLPAGTGTSAEKGKIQRC